MFPQAIGVASTFRPELNQAIADAVRAQMRAIGAHQGLSPVLDICRDPRWGRLEETYGEDPYLVVADGVGLRPRAAGRRPRATASSRRRSTSSATARPRAASTGRPRTCPSASCATSTCARSRRRCATPGSASVMNAYHELDGVPCGANRWLLTDLLRGEWGFDGTVVSDYFAVTQLDEYHHVVGDVGGGGGAGADGRHRRRAARAPTATAIRCARRSTAATSRSTSSTRPWAACARRQVPARACSSEPYVDVDAVAVHTRTRRAGRARPRRRRRQPRAARRTTARCRCARPARRSR